MLSENLQDLFCDGFAHCGVPLRQQMLAVGPTRLGNLRSVEKIRAPAFCNGALIFRKFERLLMLQK